MEIDREKIDKAIKRAKKLVASMVRKQDKEMIMALEKHNQRLCLAVAEFKCQNQKCGNEKNLQMHHLIMRGAKKFMDFWRYASQRYYWANQIVLCRRCHKDYHEEMGGFYDKDSLCIEEERIKNIKEKFVKKGKDVKNG